MIWRADELETHAAVLLTGQDPETSVMLSNMVRLPPLLIADHVCINLHILHLNYINEKISLKGRN